MRKWKEKQKGNVNVENTIGNPEKKKEWINNLQKKKNVYNVLEIANSC